ncbi:hypothetical protein F5X99DRAFT_371224 [Biscogniauxia marginata]|nr:hypothetical protein F5X99DRAFT_371224 [Biscogniauxia marginata]
MDPSLHQPYPPQYQQSAHEIPVSKSWHITKIVFISLSMIFCIIVIGVSIALAVDPDVLSFAIIWTIPQAGVSLIWSIAELITICSRAGRRGIHPGAHVALHLLLWMGFIVGVALTGFLLATALLYRSDWSDYYDYYYDDDYYDYYSNKYIGLLQALTAFLVLLVIVHFFLFVRACVETARRNRISTPIIMVPQPVYYQTAMQPTQQVQENIQPGYPTQPRQAHLSGYYGQPKELQQHITGSSTGHISQPSVPTQVYEDGLHPTSPQQ